MSGTEQTVYALANGPLWGLCADSARLESIYYSVAIPLDPGHLK